MTVFKLFNPSYNAAVSLSITGNSSNAYNAINLGPRQSLRGKDMNFSSYQDGETQSSKMIDSIFSAGSKGYLEITKDGNAYSADDYKTDNP